MDLTKIYQVASQCAFEAGELIKDVRKSEELELKVKGSSRRDLVTRADLEAERLITETIRNKFPDHRFFSEEFQSQTPDTATLQGPLWVIDPIDGTTNYAYGHFQVGISIAFALNGVVQVGVVYAPFVNEKFHGIKGGGAYLNDRPIKPSGEKDLEGALVATGLPYNRSEVAILNERLLRVVKQCRDIRRLGAASLDICWVASGRIDAYYETVCPWDMAAGCLIAREAGAKVGHITERPADEALPPDLYAKELLVSNEKLFGKLQSLLRIS